MAGTSHAKTRFALMPGHDTSPWPSTSDIPINLFSKRYRQPMTAYVINEITISDPALYKTYADRMPSTLTPFGGVFLARGTPEAISGAIPSPRVVIVQFPDVEKAKAWRNSPAYAELLVIRDRASTSRVYVIDGV
jgi:uncharacterized protein (DUF1330 family)